MCECANDDVGRVSRTRGSAAGSVVAKRLNRASAETNRCGTTAVIDLTDGAKMAGTDT